MRVLENARTSPAGVLATTDMAELPRTRPLEEHPVLTDEQRRLRRLLAKYHANDPERTRPAPPCRFGPEARAWTPRRRQGRQMVPERVAWLALMCGLLTGAALALGAVCLFL